MSRWLPLLLVTMLACKGSSDSTAAARLSDGSAAARTVHLDPSAMKRLGINVQGAGTATSTRTLRVPGTLEYNFERYAEVGVPLEGRVTRVDARIGDHVKKGQTLAQIIVPQVASAQADFLVAQAGTLAARKNRDREDDLLSRQLTTAREDEVARSEATKAEADLAAAEARLRALRVAIPRDNSVVASAGTLALSAPLDGVVVARKANLGVYLTPADTAFVVADLSELWATLDVHENELSYLRIGADVAITLDALEGKTVHGKLALIEPVLGRSTRSARARVVVPNADGSLRPGLFCRAQVALPADVVGRLLIVAAAVQQLDDSHVVFIEHDPGTFEVREVQVGRKTAEIVEITGGLSAGEKIVTSGAFLLRGELTLQ